MHVQILKGFHQAPRHVASLGCLDSSVHKALTPPHGVEKELSSTEAAIERGCHKALGLGRLVAAREVRQRSVLQPVCIRVMTSVSLLRGSAGTSSHYTKKTGAGSRQH